MGIIVGVAFAAILASLVAAGVFMMRSGRGDGSKGGAMMRALALRVAISIALFLCLIASWQLGWIHPTGVPLAR